MEFYLHTTFTMWETTGNGRQNLNKQGRMNHDKHVYQFQGNVWNLNFAISDIFYWDIGIKKLKTVVIIYDQDTYLYFMLLYAYS